MLPKWNIRVVWFKRNQIVRMNRFGPFAKFSNNVDAVFVRS